jgi:hypothetical protein
VTNRKVASLSSGLLARKGAARPAEPSAEAEETGSVMPASADSADQIASNRDAVGNHDEAKRDYRAYAWPNQGAPAEDDLAMPAPPSPADVEQAMAAVRRGDRIRRLAISGIAAAVVAGLVVIVVRDGRKDEARLAASTAPPVITATPAAPSAAPAETPPSAMAADAPAPAAPSAQPETAARRATADVPREIRDVAPSSGSPLPPRADMELAPRIPPVPTQMAAIPKAPPEPSSVDAATLAPPPVERPSEETATAAPQPKPRPAAKRPAETATAAAGHYAVQIASIGSKERAAAERSRLSRHLAPLLGGRALVIERATVAGYGTVYRIRAPGYANLAAARKACTQIKSRGLGCLVVRL